MDKFSDKHELVTTKSTKVSATFWLEAVNPIRAKTVRRAPSKFRTVLVLISTLIMTVACNNEKIQSLTPIPDTGMGSDSFVGNGPLLDYTTNNSSALPEVVRKDGRYHATLLKNNNNVTLHFNGTQGRLDAKRLAFPFEFIARNIGIGTQNDSQVPPEPDGFPSASSLYMFAGIQVHHLDLDSRDSAHFVVGHRGSTSFTIEGKNTVKGQSSVNDAGQGIVPAGRADLRVVGHADRTLTWYWQQPNMDPVTQTDDWIAYRGNGNFPGQQADFGNEVYIGLITYAFNESSLPFVGTCDAVQWVYGTL